MTSQVSTGTRFYMYIFDFRLCWLFYLICRLPMIFTTPGPGLWHTPKFHTPQDRSVNDLNLINSSFFQHAQQTKPPHFPPRRVAHASLHLFGSNHTHCYHDDEICTGTGRTTSSRIKIHKLLPDPMSTYQEPMDAMRNSLARLVQGTVTAERRLVQRKQERRRHLMQTRRSKSSDTK